MTHIWIRSEQRANESRTGVTPDGVKALMAAGIDVTVEHSPHRIIPDAAFAETGCAMAPEGSWPDAPRDAIIFGLKELPEDDTPLKHQHIMFGHAYKGQPSGQTLLRRFKSGGGCLLDLEYLTTETGRRVAAFGYWAGYAGAAVALKCWAAQQENKTVRQVEAYKNAEHLAAETDGELTATGRPRPTALIIGALGRVGTGVSDLCSEVGVASTKWDMAETASGGPFPEILKHNLFFNCILARPGTPVFVAESDVPSARDLTVIGDIACDPDSDYSPIKVYDRATTWDAPATRVSDNPPLDVTAIDNLPSLLPLESSEDFAEQLLPSLMGLPRDTAVWRRARELFRHHAGQL